MKTKLSRILGVALTVALLASLFGFAAPVAAQPGDQTWAAQTIPTGTGNVILDASDVADIAVSSDGTIYVINNDDGVDADSANAVFKSVDGGQSFTACTTNTNGTNGRFYNAIAVAPDNSNIVLITDGLDCFLSTDAGSAWTTLGTDVVTSVAAGAEVLDVDVSPAISGALFGRHYVRAVAIDTAAVCAVNGAQLMGVQQTDWTAITTSTNGDCLAVKFSPSYVGDRALAMVYNTGTDTFFDIISQPEAAAETRTQTTDITDITSLDYQDQDTGGIATDSLICADIALPSDWDPTLTAGQVSYVSVGSEGSGNLGAGTADRGGLVGISANVTTDDVYRIDADAAIALNGTTSLPVHSIAYDGTIATGTLFLGERSAANVKWTLNPTSSAPTWTSTSKAPTGDDSAAPNENCTVVRIAPDGNIYAGTRDIWQSGGSDDRSAFSVSTDAGKTFNQTALIDVGAATLVNIDDFMVTPDGGTIFMASDDGSDLSLWKSSTPTGSASWERVYCRTAVGPGIVRLAPDYADNPSIYWANQAAANMYVSHDGGVIFANRTPSATIVDLAIESGGASGVCYMSNGTDVYKSTNGGYFFGLAEPTLVTTAAATLSMAPAYPAMPEAGTLIVGGTGSVAYSTDSAASFTLIDGGLAAAGVCVVGADEAYATNGTIYAAGVTDGEVYRFAIGTDSTWTDLSALGTACRGIAMSNGVLYAADLTVNLGVMRTLTPLAAAGTLTWESMTTGTAVGATFALTPNCLRVVDNVAYAVDTAAAAPGELEGYTDLLATAVPVLSSPADGVTIGVDPVSGYGEWVTIAWGSIGTGTGLVTDFDIWVTKTTDTAWSSARQFNSVAVGDPGAPSTNLMDAGATAPDQTCPLLSNTSYMWRVRGEDMVSGDNIRGQWSESRAINVQAGTQVQAPHAGPQLLGPASGATDVSVNPGFSWAPLPGATKYRFWLALDAGLTLTVEETPVDVTEPAWQVPPGTLESDTTYFWGVQAIEPTESPLSINTFRTMAVDVYACPFCTETFGTAGALDSHIAAVHPAATPAYIWAIIVIGAVLMIAVIMLIVKTRRVV